MTILDYYQRKTNLLWSYVDGIYDYETVLEEIEDLNERARLSGLPVTNDITPELLQESRDDAGESSYDENYADSSWESSFC